ncbi:multicopper oxidase family protein [Kangiella koreensis]|uniref:Multicopper oxidase type 3 n=1 Tax=Kangiella koreensis (strain DSM 16069 / JCM 12317 / KCTC 12182 / SW-125) TaxID=523791 RepID=C7RAY6_KANKD|nr:multicopper oxidase family protein [Kangiella koreensis]ACV26428.1 multicopper oxidase type 3 [Kangiella koreensis DSM 16069]
MDFYQVFKRVFKLFILIIFSVNCYAETTFSKPVLDVVDLNPDENIFEAELSIGEQDVTLDSQTVHTIIYKDDNRVGGYPAIEPDGIPVPQIVVTAGDTVIVKFTNTLPSDCAAVACNSSIHWHGIELDNDSDGTGVTQNRLTENQEYIYRFIAPRPGVFWFHPHMMPGPQTFAGAYGALIVKDPNEPMLQASGVIPSEDNTHTLVLSDIEFDADGDVGLLDGAEAVPWTTLAEECGNTGAGCTGVANGVLPLVNGQEGGVETPVITAKAGSGVRLRLINTSTNRYFRLAVTNNGSDNNIYRIGGEGGFLETVRLEGGTLGSWDTKINKGEVLISASQRADVVVVPQGNDGDIITVNDVAFSRGGPPLNHISHGPLFYIKIDNSLSDPGYTIAEDDEILGSDGIENLKDEVITDVYSDPTVVFDSNPGAGKGSDDPIIRLVGISAGKIGIDDVIGHFETSGPDYTQVPYQDATRYAKTGDTIEFTISNFTQQHHPFHHHGFSFQPVRVIDNGADMDDLGDDSVLYEFDYEEFVDVIDVYMGQSVVLRMRLEDRPRITDTRQELDAPAPNQYFGSGGAAGRWVFHCHLFLHATIGMISELVVLDTDRDGDGVTTEFDCDDFDPSITFCNTPPTANAGVDQVAECSAFDGSSVILNGSASTDPEGDTLSYFWTAPGIVFDDPTSVTPSADFPLGDTVVTLTVSDGEFSDADEVTVTVEDTTDPSIVVTLDKETLWAPNHKLIDIETTVEVTDVCDANPSFELTSITSNEPDDGTGDGSFEDDIAGADYGLADLMFQLRAERDGSEDGRIYTIIYTATDGSGNSDTSESYVVVPHN